MDVNLIKSSEVRNALETLREMPTKLGELLEQSRAESIAIGLNTNLSLTGKNDAYNKSATKFMGQVDVLEQQAKTMKGVIENWIGEQFQRPAGDAASELLYEFKLSQSWRRIERILDGIEQRASLIRTIEELINDFVKSDDMLSLEALQTELDVYLKSRNMAMPNEISNRILEVRAAHASPNQRAALALLDEMSTSYPRLTACFSEVRRCLQNRATIGILPGWNLGEQVSLNMPAEPAGYSWS